MKTVLFTHGISLIGLGMLMLIPMILEVYRRTPDWQEFALTAFFSIFAGGTLVLTNRSDKYTLSVRHGYLLTTTLWITIPICGALPFYFSTTEYHLSFTDAMFECVSAISTSGGTVYVGLDNAPKGLLLWRSLLTLIGGVGIVVLTMTLFPYLRVGGMQLFQTESSDRSDKILPRVHEIALITIMIFLSLVMLCAIAYYWAGMSGFDAVAHAFSTVATAGMGTRDASFTDFSPAVHWVGVVFMMAGATPLLLYYSLVTRTPMNRILLSQAKVYWAGLALVVSVIALYGYYERGLAWEQAWRESAFNIVSVATTTGFASADYNLWGHFPTMVFYLLFSMGGCTGSTSGGIKVFRLQVMFKMLLVEFRRLLTPHGVFTAKLGGKVLSDSVMRSVGFFFVVYSFTFCLVALGIALSGMDMVTSLSGAASALSAVGPGLGEIIGPAGNFSTLPDLAKWSLIIGMLAGRLEIVTILVLLSRHYWRDFR